LVKSRPFTSISPELAGSDSSSSAAGVDLQGTWNAMIPIHQSGVDGKLAA